MVNYFCLNVDTEADFYYLTPSPHINKIERLKWRANSFLGKTYKYPQGINGLKNVVSLLKELKFPATFNIVGHLYLKSCNGFPHFDEIKPKADWFFKKDWYYWDKPSDYKKRPGLYAGNFIEEEMMIPYFDLGLHSFSHEIYPFENAEMISKSIIASKKAANNIGIKLKTFSPPCNIIEEVSEPEKVYAILKENGFKGTIFMGEDNKNNLNNYNAHQYHKTDIKPVFMRHGLLCTQVSGYIEGSSSKNSSDDHIQQIKNSIENCADNTIFLLNTHDFTHKKTDNLRLLLNWVKKRSEEGKLKIINLAQYFEMKNEIK